MSNTYVFIVFFAMIFLLILLVAKFKIHAVTSLFFVSIILGILIKTPINEIPKILNEGFGGTMKNVGIIILLGALLGEVMSNTGAVLKITQQFIKWFGKKHAIAAVGVSAYIMGIPIFPDTVSLLLIPMLTNLASETGISMMAFAGIVGIGVTTSSLVPPTPGPVAGAALLNLPLGQAIPWGIMVSIPGLIATIIYCKTLKKQVPLNDAYLKSSDENIKLPSFATSITPIVIPVVLIVLNTVINTIYPESKLSSIFAFIGSPVIALTIGCLYAIISQVNNWWKNDDVKTNWIDKALLGAAGPVFITALGGSLAAFIKNAGVAEMLADMIINAHIPGIFVPMLIALLIRSITGSNTLGVTTAAALCQPMLTSLGISPLAAYLSMCSGAVIVSHANSSGFWLVSTMCKLDVKDSFVAISGASAISGIFCCATTLILYFLGII